MIEPGSERWNYLVAEGTRVSSLRNWFLGDAALEIAPMGDDRSNNGALAHVERYAEEVGVGTSSIREYRRVANAWPHANRVACGWKVHQILASRPDLIRPGMTVTEAHRAAGQAITGRTGPKADPKDQARAVRDMLRDPEVRREYEAQVIANGGKFPTLDELNSRGGGALDEVMSQGDRFSAKLRRFDAALDDLLAEGPWGENTHEARELQARNLRLLDAVISTSRVTS